MFNDFRQKILSGVTGLLGDQGPLSFFSQWFSPNNQVSILEELQQYKGVVHTCVSAIAQEVARVQFVVKRQQPDGTLKPVAEHSILKVLRNPNENQSDFQFFEMLETHLKLAGEAFIFMQLGDKTKRPKKLYLMRPDLVYLTVDPESGNVVGYSYRRYPSALPLIGADGKTIDPSEQSIPLDLDEVMHIKLPNPVNPYRGMGVVQAGIIQIQTDDYAQRYSRNYLFNNARPSGVLSIKGNINPNEFERIKRNWNREYGTVDNAGKTAIIRNLDAEFIAMEGGMSQVDMKELKNLTRDDIMMMFRVSKTILGITEDVNYSNAKTAEYVFAKRVIDPDMNRIADALQPLMERFKLPSQKTADRLSYESPVPKDTEESAAYYARAVNQWLTVNEIRNEEGYLPTPGGDVLRQPFSLVPIDDPESVDEAVNTGKSIRSKRATLTIRKTVKKKSKPSTFTGPQVERFRDKLVAAEAHAERMLKKEIAGILDEQQARILDRLVAKKKDASHLTYDDSEQQNVQSFVEKALPIALALFASQYDLANEFIGEGDAPAFELTPGIEAALRARITRAFEGYSQDTQQAIADAISEGYQSGATIDEVSNAIAEVFKEAKSYRSDRIANTELHHLSNMAAEEAYRVAGYEAKVWHANPDACQYCMSLDGQIESIGDPFVVQGTSITGVDGGTMLLDWSSVELADLHPNCRCTLVPIILGSNYQTIAGDE